MPVAKFRLVAKKCSEQGVVASDQTSQGSVRSPVSRAANREVKGETLVTSRHAINEVTATGSRSGLGQDDASLGAIRAQPTWLRG